MRICKFTNGQMGKWVATGAAVLMWLLWIAAMLRLCE